MVVFAITDSTDARVPCVVVVPSQMAVSIQQLLDLLCKIIALTESKCFRRSTLLILVNLLHFSDISSLEPFGHLFPNNFLFLKLS